MQQWHADEIFRQVVEAAPNGMIVARRDGQIVVANRAACKLFGYLQDEMLSISIETLVPTRYRDRHPQLRESFFSSPEARSMGAGRDLYGLRKDGSEFSVEIGLNPIVSGNEIFVIASVIDITQRRRAQEMFRRVVEAAPNGMVMVNREGMIVLANEQTSRLFLYAKDELLDKSIEVLVPERFRGLHPQHRTAYFMNPQVRAMGAGRDLYGLRKDGTEFPVEIGLNPIQSEEGLFVLAAIIDITERKRAEERIIASLNEKEVMLKEIHHRVKNNLAVVSSLFYLQSTYIKDPQTAAMFQESQDRVRSMALVHETLYRSQNLAAIDMVEYTRALSDYLLRTYKPGHALLSLNCDPLSLTVEQAIPCGLILNELVVNCLKHAFPEGSSGEIRVRIEKGDTYTLCVADNGVGLPAELNIETARTLGLRLIRSLTGQLNGTVEFLRMNPGTEVRINFSITA